MGRTIYFTDKELHALRDTSSEWLDMMGNGDEESIKCVEERLVNSFSNLASYLQE